MKNILNTTKDLKLYDENKNLIYSNVNWKSKSNSDGYSSERTYDSKGNELTFKDSDGLKIGFDIPELTMEEVIKKIGNFKLVKK